MGRFAVYPSLEGRVVVVSGGATGIGAEMVRAFARQRARVAFLDVQEDAAHELVETLAEEGAEAPVFLACDMTDVPAVESACRSLEQRLGPAAVLVNNAGNDTRHEMEDVTQELWDRTMAVNLRHQFFMTQALVPGMKRAGGGSIVNMSSIAWLIPSIHAPVYVTAKAAIVGMTRTLAHELGGFGIRVNSVLPGAIATERQRRLWLTPEYTAEVLANQALPRLIEPEEVARLVLFLAADDSQAITSQAYVIDGGWV